MLKSLYIYLFAFFGCFDSFQVLSSTKNFTPAGPVPNEMGKIAVITYHQIGNTDTSLIRKRSGFREDLKLLKEEGFYPIKVSDFMRGIFRVPKGRKPVIISFDDSSFSQFEMDKEGNISLDSAVGIMEEFKLENPDFPLTAIFFVSANTFFGQPSLIKKKMEFLINSSYEIGNHTFTHLNFRFFPNQVSEQIAFCQRDLYKFLPYTMYAMATPYGSFPPEKYENSLIQGTVGQSAYKNEIVFDYSNQLSFSPFDIRFDRFKVHRIHGHEQTIRKLVKDLNSYGTDAFISDGDEHTLTVRDPNDLIALNIRKSFCFSGRDGVSKNVSICGMNIRGAD
ncbi:MAG TPA: polysaccharide deacetylase family protein [Leptospiraceae bacterium]|nr:polysaccharide deacetylase family protein [Leptospiraceae bacterium]HMY68803.1 polysaccharide deacetylase family protein [Leptospiraceae bacterium]HNF16855.1 polysaccharide deacetylase family protein [Leptospiraceae bacterium]HNN07146.1 polysaccharide deacetylase family protein [Leptospiraceae bacterium]